MDKVLADPRFASLYGSLTAVRGRLARRVDMARRFSIRSELKPEEVKSRED